MQSDTNEPKLDPEFEAEVQREAELANEAVLHTTSLLRRYDANDLEALNVLFQRYYPQVVRLVKLRLGAKLRGRMSVEDCVQETFVDALKGLKKFEYRGPGSFMNWLAVIALRKLSSERDRNSAQKRDMGRERALESMRASASNNSNQFDPAADSLPIPDRVALNEMIEKLASYYEQLPEEQRRVLEYRDILVCTWPEIAELMNLSNEMAAKRLHIKARLRLGSLLGRDPGKP